jgi:hypothetical protein
MNSKPSGVPITSKKTIVAVAFAAAMTMKPRGHQKHLKIQGIRKSQKVREP